MHKILGYLFTILILTACNKQSEELNTIITDTNLCIYTNESQSHGKDSFLVELAKIDLTKTYKTVYEKSYDNVDLPIEEKKCILIPLNIFEKNQPYVITLGTINHTYRARVCVIQNNNENIIKPVEAGKSNC